MPIDAAEAKTLFLAALEKPAPARAAYLLEACSDSELRQRVAAMLHAHEASGELLRRPAEALLDETPATHAEGTVVFSDQPESPRTEADSGGLVSDELPYLQPATLPGYLGRLGHYEIQQVVGKGGFGTVLKAFDEKLHRVVAIKVLAPEVASSGTARQRFIREARASAPIAHEHVVAIHAIQEEHKPPFIVMQYIDGQSLQDKLDKVGALNVKEILRIGLQIAEGLAAAHKHGLIHRDIKPANILLENGVERVKITDFGLARAIDDASVTQSGVIAGTPMYMAPEQAAGEPMDHRTDLFSLGSVLYAMCTGKPPFRASGTMAVLKRVIEDTPRPIRESNPEMPEWLCAIIAKLHAKKPGERYQSARGVADVLGQHLAQLQQPTARPSGVALPVSASMPQAPAPTPTQPTPLLRRLVTGLALFACVCTALATAAYFAGQHFKVYPPHIALPGAGIALAGALFLATGALLVRARPRLRQGLWSAARYCFLTAVGLGAIILVVFDGGAHSNFSIACDDPEVQLRLEGDWVEQDLEAGSSLQLPPGKYLLTAAKNGTIYYRNNLDLPPRSGSGVRVPSVVVAAALPSTTGEGWVQLFNGKDLTGWKQHPKFPGSWRVEKGVLVGRGLTKLSYLATERNDYADFHLVAEVFLPAVRDGGGIVFRGSLDSTQDPNLGEVLARPLFAATVLFQESASVQAGSLYWNFGGKNWGSLAAPTELTRPKEWFTLEIIARGPHVVTKVNGRPAAESKGFSPAKAGHILLERLGANREIHFRKIALKDLSVTPARPKGDWVQLFNGKDLEGWETEDKDGWTVDKGVLTGKDTGKTAPLFTTKKDWRSFHLRTEVKINRRGKAALLLRHVPSDLLSDPGKGVKLHLTGDPAGPRPSGTLAFQNSFEAEKIQKALATTRPEEWFHLDVIASENSFTVKIDGKEVSRGQGHASTHQAGQLGLQVWADDNAIDSPQTEIYFKKFEIKELPSGEMPPAEYALEFDGKTTHVAMPSLRLETDKPLTMEAWVKFGKGEGPTETIASSYSSKSALLLCRFNGKSAVFLARRDLQSSFAGLEGQAIADSDWVHVAGVWDGEEARVFVNGKLESSTTLRPVPAQAAAQQSQHLYLGAEKVVQGQPLGAFFRGILGQVQLSSSVRYTKDFNPERRFKADKHTVALYHANAGEGDKLTDASGNNHHGTIVGAKWVKTEPLMAAGR